MANGSLYHGIYACTSNGVFRRFWEAPLRPEERYETAPPIVYPPRWERVSHFDVCDRTNVLWAITSLGIQKFLSTYRIYAGLDPAPIWTGPHPPINDEGNEELPPYWWNPSGMACAEDGSYGLTYMTVVDSDSGEVDAAQSGLCKISAGGDVTKVSELVFDQIIGKSGGHVFHKQGVWMLTAGGVVYTSPDGAAWTEVTVPGYTPDGGNAEGAYLSPGEGTNWWLIDGTSNKVFRTEDNGATWDSYDAPSSTVILHGIVASEGEVEPEEPTP